jgi:hypothetical protein
LDLVITTELPELSRNSEIYLLIFEISSYLDEGLGPKFVLDIVVKIQKEFQMFQDQRE